jgi:ApaG protein
MSNTTAVGIEINVANKFRQEISNSAGYMFVHSYEISIVNNLRSTVKLLSREWNICHLTHGASHVFGEGVVGKQPVLLPGENFTYTSGCELLSPIGSMHGKFFFQNLNSMELFSVDIPKFYLYYPPILN